MAHGFREPLPSGPLVRGGQDPEGVLGGHGPGVVRHVVVAGGRPRHGLDVLEGDAAVGELRGEPDAADEVGDGAGEVVDAHRLGEATDGIGGDPYTLKFTLPPRV